MYLKKIKIENKKPCGPSCCFDHHNKGEYKNNPLHMLTDSKTLWTYSCIETEYFISAIMAAVASETQDANTWLYLCV